MKQFQYILYLFLLSIGITFTGCSDDYFSYGPDNEQNNRGVTVYVPRVSKAAATRAENVGATRTDGKVWDFDSHEADIDKLYFFAFSDDPDTDPVREKLVGDGSTSQDDELEGYVGYTVNIAPGDYRMYVIANYDLESETATYKYNTIDEDNLKLLKISDATELTSASGLPMSCSSLQIKDNSGNYYSPEKIPVAAGASEDIKADLQFAVSKVRTTLLNDIDPKRTVSTTETKVKNCYKESRLIGNLVNFSGSKSSEISFSGGYFDMPEFVDEEGNKLTVKTVNVDDLTPITLDDSKKWAWQAVTYVGEYLFGSSAPSATEQPSIYIPFTDGSSPATSAICGGNGISRSMFYDIVGTPEGKFYMTVQPWDPVTMALSVHGAYYLHLNKTEIEVKAGEPVEIHYETNGNLDFINPKTATGEDIYDITYSPEDNIISVALGPTISKAEAESITSGTDKSWKYIGIKAGTIIKYIEVTDIKYSQYLTVQDQTVTVDVSERIGSGVYYGDIVLPIKTNLENFTIEKTSGWDVLIDEEYATKSLMLQTPEGISFSSTDPVPGNVSPVSGSEDTAYSVDMTSSTTGVFNMRLRYSGLNEGREYWKTQHSLTLTIKGTVIDESGNSRVEESEIVISVVPSNDKYKIHVKSDWSNTHIYVYQCLQFPSDMRYYCADSEGYPYSTYSKLESKPVGAENKDGGLVAALEYSFTGALAFKGWTRAWIDKKNTPTQGTTSTEGFEKFTSNPKEWCGNYAGWENHYYDFDFCAEYRETITGCDDCTDKTKFNRGWPGIKMKPEGGGWYLFELSGVATPGKALIIFTENHGGGGQYPDVGHAGIPLFDYPSREGWIDITSSGSKTFTSDRPSNYNPSDPNDPTYTYGVRGQLWDGSNWKTTVMTHVGSGKWQLLNVDVKKDKQFGIAGYNSGVDTSGDGNDLWYVRNDGQTGVAMNTPMVMKNQKNTNNLMFSEDGNYSFFFDENAKTLIVAETMYFIGNQNDWTLKSEAYRMTTKDGLTYTITLDIADDKLEFKFNAGEWDSKKDRILGGPGSSVMQLSEGENEISSGDATQNMKFPKGGNVTLTLKKKSQDWSSGCKLTIKYN